MLYNVMPSYVVSFLCCIPYYTVLYYDMLYYTVYGMLCCFMLHQVFDITL